MTQKQWNALGVKLFLAVMLAIAAITKLTDAHGARTHHEAQYNEAWCADQGGRWEVRLENGTRVDCLTEHYAIEADFADKYSEGVGQALHYAAVTGKAPGILLIVEDWERDQKYVDRLRQTIWYIDDMMGRHSCPSIRVWIVTPAFLK